MEYCKLPFYILLLKVTITNFHVSKAGQISHGLTCNNINCLAKWKPNQEKSYFQSNFKDNLDLSLWADNLIHKKKPSGNEVPVLSDSNARAADSRGRNHKRVRKKKNPKRLKHMRRRRRRRPKRRFQDNVVTNDYKDRGTLKSGYHNFKRGFGAPPSKNNIYPKRENIFFPVTKFGNFTSNEIHPPALQESRKTKKKKNQNYNRKRRRRSRWRHLNPHSMKVKKLIVRIHNVLRGRVSPPAKNMLAMTWHDGAFEHAQRWADECKPSAISDHPSVRWTPLYGTCGQNVHVAFKKKRWGRVVRHWWNERRNFHFGLANNYTKVHQYTQMAWYNSHKVGCGFSQCSNRLGKTFYRYVCNYCPGGNDPRRLSEPYTRGRQCESCPDSCRSVCKGGRCKLCTNACPFSDLWVNCESLSRHWNEWLCTTRTIEGINRFKNCRATCQCKDKIT